MDRIGGDGAVAATNSALLFFIIYRVYSELLPYRRLKLQSYASFEKYTPLDFI